MYTSSAPSQFHRVLQMQHLVKKDVFDGVSRHARVIKDAADHDGVVGGIVVTEAAAGVILAPSKLGPSHQAVKEATIEVVEDFFQMIVTAAGGVDVLASAHLPQQASLGGNIVAGDVAPKTRAMRAIDGSAIELGEEDVGYRVQHGFGSTLKQIG